MELFGRLPKSDARGCSLSVEEVDRFFIQSSDPVYGKIDLPIYTLFSTQSIPTVQKFP